MSEKHTPGPWTKCADFVDARDERGFMCGNDDNSVCRCYGPDADANARLIAAAPELLSACGDLLAFVDSVVGKAIAGKPCRNAARAAIAKATGKS